MTDVLTAFRPPWWLRNPHAQTIVATWFKPSRITGQAERVELNDGDFIDLIWYGYPRAGQKVVLLLHGLEGSENSHYIRSMVPALLAASFAVVFMYHRGCSPEHNRLARSYHSGETSDLSAVLGHITQRTGRPPFAAIGFSLGANVLLKYLGEHGKDAQLERAVAVSTPFDLYAACKQLNRGFSRVYQYHLISSLIRRYREKFATFSSPLTVDVAKLRTFFAFDDQVTAVLNGFDGAQDYYNQSSAAGYIEGIRTPCLVIHADDDPFLPCRAIPGERAWPEHVQLALSPHGGHVGFIQGGEWPRRWLSQVIPAYLTSLDLE